MSWLSELVSILETNSVGLFNSDIFTTTMASIPVLASGAPTLQIIETSGSGAERTQNQTRRPAFIYPSAQFTARADDYDTAHDKALEAWDALVQIRNEFVESGWYREIKMLNNPFDAGADSRGQAQCKFNVVAIKRPY